MSDHISDCFAQLPIQKQTGMTVLPLCSSPNSSLLLSHTSTHRLARLSGCHIRSPLASHLLRSHPPPPAPVAPPTDAERFWSTGTHGRPRQAGLGRPPPTPLPNPRWAAFTLTRVIHDRGRFR